MKYIMILIILFPTFLFADTFGNNDSQCGSQLNLEDYIGGSKFTCGGDGTLDSIYVYVTKSNTGTNYLSCAVYLESDSSRVDTTIEFAAALAGANWYAFSLEIGASVSTSTDYFLFAWMVGGGGDNEACLDADCSPAGSAHLYAPYDHGTVAWPATFSQSGGGTGSGCVPIYAVYSTGGEGESGRRRRILGFEFLDDLVVGFMIY